MVSGCYLATVGKTFSCIIPKISEAERRSLASLPVRTLTVVSFCFKRQFPIFYFNIKIQLTLEQPGFKLHGSTYMWIFFNGYTVSAPYPWVSRQWIQPTRFLNTKSSIFYMWLGIHGCRGPPVCTVLHHFIKGLEHPWILLPVGGPATNPPWILRDNCSQKLYSIAWG